MIDRLSRFVWCKAYAIEQARQDHASERHLWRQAGCCIALSVFRFIGGRI